MIMFLAALKSLDNVLAVAGAAHGNLWPLVFGLLLSIPLVGFTRGWIAGLMDRYKMSFTSPWKTHLAEFFCTGRVLAIPVLLLKRATTPV